MTSLRAYAPGKGAFGSIIANDEETYLEDIQIATRDGMIEFMVQAPAEANSGTIVAQSVAGNASGRASFNVIMQPGDDDDIHEEDSSSGGGGCFIKALFP